MKIVANIPSFIKLIHCLKYLNKHKKDIEAAKAAGDLEKEREHILSATSLWGPMVFKMFNSKVNVEGLENLPDEGPVVFVGNHQGMRQSQRRRYLPASLRWTGKSDRRARPPEPPSSVQSHGQARKFGWVFPNAL